MQRRFAGRAGQRMPMPTTITAPPRKPFRATQLPLLARCYRDGFRSGHTETLNPARRFVRRLAFYALLRGSDGRQQGELALRMPDGERLAPFNARNRQFNSIYFDKFAFAYEPEVSLIVDHAIADGGVFYDIGANWGYFSFYLASRPGFGGQIHSFEPWPPTFEDLAGLTAALGMQGHITCHGTALGGRTGEGHMQAASHSGLVKLSAEDGQGVAVQLAALDDLNLPAPDLIKLDVEGAELAVLSGAARVLATARPGLIFENSLKDGDPDESCAVLSHLEQAGYRLTVPQLVARDRKTGEEGDVTTYFDARTHDYLRMECRPFRAADRLRLGAYLNIYAYHPENPPAFLAGI